MNLLKSLLLVTAAAAFATSAQAANFTFNVDLHTSALSSLGTDPFSLELELNSGGGTSSNIATVSNFQFTGGSPVGASDSSFSNSPASASGDFSTGFTLNTNPAFTPGQNAGQGASGLADIAQAFDASVTDIKFTVTLSNWSTGTTPDNFVVNIFDSTGNYLTTSDPNGGFSLLEAALGTQLAPATVANNVRGFSSTGDDDGVFATASVPEPSTWALGIAGLALLALVTQSAKRLS